MKKSFSESPVGKFLLGKGFYAALAVCVLGAGAAAWVIVDKTIDFFYQPAAGGLRYNPAKHRFQRAGISKRTAGGAESLQCIAAILFLLQCAFLLFGAGSVFRGFRRIRTGYHFSKLRRILLYASC